MLVFVYIGGVRPPLFAGLSPTPYTGMHSRTVLLAPPFGPSNSDESQQPTIAADVCSRTRSRQTGRAPRGDTTARAPLWPRFPARHRRRGGLTWGRGHPATAPGLLDGCILGAATSPPEGQGRAMPCTSAPAGQDVPYEPRSSRGAPQRTVHRRPAITAAVPLQGKTVLPVTSCVAAPATPTPGDRCAPPTTERQRARPRGGEGGMSVGSGRPRAPLPIVPPRRHHARTLREGRFT